jgi:hypothetical protein
MCEPTMLLTSDLHQSGIRCKEQAYNTGTGSVSLRLYVTCTNDDHIALGEDQGKPSSLLQVARVQSIEIMCIFMCECLPQLRLGLSYSLQTIGGVTRTENIQASCLWDSEWTYHITHRRRRSRRVGEQAHKVQGILEFGNGGGYRGARSNSPNRTRAGTETRVQKAGPPVGAQALTSSSTCRSCPLPCLPTDVGIISHALSLYYMSYNILNISTLRSY